MSGQLNVLLSYSDSTLLFPGDPPDAVYDDYYLTSASGGGFSVGYFLNIPAGTPLFGDIAPYGFKASTIVGVEALNDGSFSIQLWLSGHRAQDYWTLARLAQDTGSGEPAPASGSWLTINPATADTYQQTSLSSNNVTRWLFDQYSAGLTPSPEFVLGIGNYFLKIRR